MKTGVEPGKPLLRRVGKPEGMDLLDPHHALIMEAPGLQNME